VPIVASSDDQDAFRRSSYLERVLEFAFLGDLLRRLWSEGVRDVEVLRSDVDAWGYDIVLARGRVMRHVQLKASKRNGSTRTVPINGGLQDKPGGCVVWMLYDAVSLQSGPYLWFGSPPADAPPAIRDLSRARRTTPDAAGSKPLRANTFLLPKARCERLDDLSQVAERLFPYGASRTAVAEGHHAVR
jgi:hypothetical protein